MGSERASRAAESHGLGALRERYRFNGLFWFGMALVPLSWAAGWVSVEGFGWGAVAVYFVPALPFVALGALTRANKAVHIFDEGIVFTGLWGQVKKFAAWPEVSVRIKRVVPQRVGPPLYGYGVAIAGAEGFGFAARQIVGGGPGLARVLTEGAFSGRLRAGLRLLDETGSVVLGRVLITREHVRTDAHDGRPGVEIPVARISRVWVTTTFPRPNEPLERLHVATGEPAGDVILECPPADLVTAAQLIASLAGVLLDLSEVAPTFPASPK
ncbi:hypothetical protein ACFC1R_36920 [Kitasatospora sp. NPDC056138]|uniref:hypothetical protein n=1 Tax=Kitasatospora sp. NPDC056138 TaxID=3345724 RepID=UPI0035E38077